MTKQGDGHAAGWQEAHAWKLIAALFGNSLDDDLDAGSAGGDDDPARRRSCAWRASARPCARARLALHDDAAAELAPYEGAPPQHAGLPRAAALAASLQTDAAVSAACDGDGAPNAYLAAILAQPAEDIRADAAAQLEAYAPPTPPARRSARRRARPAPPLAGADGGDGGDGGGGGGGLAVWRLAPRLRQAAGVRARRAGDRAAAVARRRGGRAGVLGPAPAHGPPRLRRGHRTEGRPIPRAQQGLPLARCTTPAAAPPPPPYPRSLPPPSPHPRHSSLRFRDYTLAWHLREILTSAHALPPPARSDVLDASFIAQLDALGCWRSLICMASALRRPDGGDGAAASLAALLSRRPPARRAARRPPIPPRAPLGLGRRRRGRRRRPWRRRRRRRLVAAPLDAAPLTVEVEKLLTHEIEARPSDDSAGGGVGAAAHRALATRAPSQFRRSAELRHLVGAHAPAEALSLLLREFAPAEILRGGATARLLDELVARGRRRRAARRRRRRARRPLARRSDLAPPDPPPLLARLNGSVDERGATFATDATRIDPTLEAEAEARALRFTDVVGSGGGGASSAAALELAMVTKVAEEAKELRAALAEYKRERDGVSAPAAAAAPAGAAALLAGGARVGARPAARRVLK